VAVFGVFQQHKGFFFRFQIGTCQGDVTNDGGQQIIIVVSDAAGQGRYGGPLSGFFKCFPGVNVIGSVPDDEQNGRIFFINKPAGCNLDI
jgi:hypothetical protein